MTKRILSLLCCAAMLLGCISVAAAQDDTERKVLTATVISYAENNPYDEQLLEAIEDATGYWLDITWVPSVGYSDKINAMIASDTMTNMIVVTNPSSNVFTSACVNGGFWAIDDYIDDFPNLTKYMATTVYDKVRVEGGLYGVPRARDLIRQGIQYRLDWLEEAGLDLPETVEDIDTMVRAFAAREDCKYGLTSGYVSGSSLPEGLQYTAVYMGAPNGYGLDSNGNFTYYFTTEEYFQAVDLWRSWYADGILNADYLELNQDDGKTISLRRGETGLVFDFCDEVGVDLDALQKVDADAELWATFAIEGPDGEERAVATAGFNGIIAFPKSANTEETLLMCLDYINNSANTECADVFHYGVEGYSYHKISDTEVARTEAEQTVFNSIVDFYSTIAPFIDTTPTLQMSGEMTNGSELYETIKKIRLSEEMLAYAVGDESVGLVSETATDIGTAELMPLMGKIVNNYIMGKITEEEYWEGVAEWLDAGGQDMIDEYYVGYCSRYGIE